MNVPSRMFEILDLSIQSYVKVPQAWVEIHGVTLPDLKHLTHAKRFVGFASKVFLFTPGFSLVLVQGHYFRNRFNGFRGKRKANR